MVPLAIISSIVHGLGIPLTFAIILFKYRRLIVSGDKQTHDRFGIMYSVYKPRYFYWELCIFGRKLGIILCFLFAETIYQIMFGMTALFISLMAQVIFTPYDDRRNNNLDFISVLVPFVFLYAGLLFFTEKIYSDEVKICK